MSSRLHRDVFPDLAIDAVDGRTILLPRDLAGSYAVVLLYRGSWYPYSNAQLAAFARGRERLSASGITIVALSVDDQATSVALVDKLRLNFPVDSVRTRASLLRRRVPTSRKGPPISNLRDSCSTHPDESSRRCIPAERLVDWFLMMSWDSSSTSKRIATQRRPQHCRTDVCSELTRHRSGSAGGHPARMPAFIASNYRRSLSRSGRIPTRARRVTISAPVLEVSTELRAILSDLGIVVASRSKPS